MSGTNVIDSNEINTETIFHFIYEKYNKQNTVLYDENERVVYDDKRVKDINKEILK